MNEPDNSREDDRIIPLEQALKHAARPDGAETAAKQQQQQPDESAPPVDAGELSNEELISIVEALLFASASPLQSSRISDIIGLGSSRRANTLVEQLRQRYDKDDRPYFVQELAGGYQIRTRPRFQPWVGKLQHKQQQDTLSQAALETLSIIAYRQPLTRAEIEDIRGVQSGYILRSLIEKSLVRVAGRSEELGRPLLYGTTKEFLEAFGLASLKDLPPLDNPDTPAGQRDQDR